MWTFTTDVAEYAAAAEPFLLSDPVGNTVLLTVLADLRAGMAAPGVRLGWWRDGGRVRGAAFRTPPHPLGLAVMPVEAVAPLVEALEGDIDEVVGPTRLVEEIRRLLGRPPTRVLAERLYRLGTLAVPEVPGDGRQATREDLSLLLEWMGAFFAEVRLHGGDLRSRVQGRIARRELFLWQAGGEPVSLAALSPEAGGVCRVGPVYTPPDRRRRGYAAAVTAHACQVALAERCRQVVLFADLANPTSNSVYRSLGFEPVADHAQVTFAR